MWIELYNEAKFFVKSNLYAAAAVATALMPLLCFAVGMMGVRIPVPCQVGLIVVVQFGLYCAKRYATKVGKGRSVPVPVSRFTDVNEDGEVGVKMERLQEMILYVADVEDYLERKGLMSTQKTDHT